MLWYSGERYISWPSCYLCALLVHYNLFITLFFGSIEKSVLASQQCFFETKCIDYTEKWPFMVIFLYNLYIFEIHLPTVLYPNLCYDEPCGVFAFLSNIQCFCWCFFFFFQIINIYDNRRKMMTLGPFDYSNMDEIDLLCRLPDQFIRQVCRIILFWSRWEWFRELMVTWAIFRKLSAHFIRPFWLLS